MSATSGAKVAYLLNATDDRIRRHLQSATKPLGAYDIKHALRIRHAVTVYRSLERLIGFGLVHRLETRQAFIACDGSGSAHSPGFLICDECHGVEEIDLKAVLSLLRSRALYRKFKVEKPTVELVGRCFHCASRRKHAGDQAPGAASKQAAK
jgi:Fur family zinc uptake transcriptional regulator